MRGRSGRPGRASDAARRRPERRAEAAGAVAAWDAFESAWLGREASRLEGWRPDGPGAWCPRCGGDVGPYEADGDGCRACRGSRPAFERVIRLGAYEGQLRQAVLAAKFSADRAAGEELGFLLGRRLVEAAGQIGVEAARVVVTPVPTTWRRRVALNRGVDHTLTLARAVCRASGARLVRGLLGTHRPRQATLGASARAMNVRRRFWWRAGWPAGSAGAGVGRGVQLVVVVDDVMTTGATMRAATRAVRVGARGRSAAAGVAIWALVAGVTPRAGARSGVGTVGIGGDVARMSEDEVSGVA